MSKQYRDLSLSAKALYIHLFTQHSYLCRGNYTLPVGQSDRQLENLTGMSDRTITKAKRELAGKGWIKVENGTNREASKYWILRTDASAEVRTQNTPPASVEVRAQKYGHYIVSNKHIGCENTPHPSEHPDSPKSIAHDICNMLAEEPDELIEPPLWWERI